MFGLHSDGKKKTIFGSIQSVKIKSYLIDSFYILFPVHTTMIQWSDGKSEFICDSHCVIQVNGTKVNNISLRKEIIEKNIRRRNSDVNWVRFLNKFEDFFFFDFEKEKKKFVHMFGNLNFVDNEPFKSGKMFTR